MNNFTRNEKLKLRIAILYIITAVCMLFVLSSCNESNVEMKPIKHILNSGKQIREITIDGCEYLWVAGGNGSALTHKGNCINHKDTIK
jgi:hypothetical protein